MYTSLSCLHRASWSGSIIWFYGDYSNVTNPFYLLKINCMIKCIRDETHIFILIAFIKILFEKYCLMFGKNTVQTNLIENQVHEINKGVDIFFLNNVEVIESEGKYSKNPY